MEHLDPIKSIVLPYANFLIFLGLAIYFFRKPLNNMAKARRDKFLFAAEESKKIMEETEKIYEDLKRKEATLAQEIEDIKKKSRESAEVEAKEIIASANAVAEHLKKEAVSIAEGIIETAKSEMRQEIMKLTKENVVKKLREELDATGHKNFMKKQVDKLSHITHEVKS